MFLLVILSCIPYLPFMSDPCRRHVEDMFLFGRLRFSNRDFKKDKREHPNYSHSDDIEKSDKARNM